MNPTFRSEYGEDAFIWRHLWDSGKTAPKAGFYVDIGAMRPDANSNTSFLRDMGWHGVVIDGHPECKEFWKDIPNARFAEALVSDGHKQVVFKSNGPCSRIADHDGWEASAYPLAYILSGMGVERIDFLSIDIEGEEYNAMTTFDFERFKPQIIVAEYATLMPDGTAKSDFRLRELLLTKGYREAHRTVANIIYLRA